MAEADARHGGAATGSEEERQAPPIAHDDIMRRLLEYQRQLREGVPPSEAARVVAESGPAPRGAVSVGRDVTTTTEEVVVDLTQAEAELERGPEEGRIDIEGPARATEVRMEEPTPGVVEGGPAAVPVGTPAEAGLSQPQSTEAASGTSAWTVAARDQGLADRVAQLERTLAEIASQVSDLRQRFQDMAIAADERLADLERTLARVSER